MAKKDIQRLHGRPRAFQNSTNTFGLRSVHVLQSNMVREAEELPHRGKKHRVVFTSYDQAIDGRVGLERHRLGANVMEETANLNGGPRRSKAKKSQWCA